MSKWRKSWLKNLIMGDYDSDLDGVLDRASIPSLFGVRNEVLGKFSDPKVLILTSSMKSLLNSGEVAGVGSISANSKTMTFAGSTSQAGSTWLYWDLPVSATKVYAKATMQTGWKSISIDFCDASGSTESNPPDFYELRLSQGGTNNFYAIVDLIKNIGGSGSTLRSEDTGLASTNYITLEFFCDINTLSVWRDGVEKWIDVPADPSAISSINSVRFRQNDPNSSVSNKHYLRGDVVIVFE